jgi:hypothetical protein
MQHKKINMNERKCHLAQKAAATQRLNSLRQAMPFLATNVLLLLARVIP